MHVLSASHLMKENQSYNSHYQMQFSSQVLQELLENNYINTLDAWLPSLMLSNYYYNILDSLIKALAKYSIQM